MEEQKENKGLLQKLANNPILTLIFGIASLLGLVTGFYFYFQSIKEAKPLYSVISDDLISDSKSNSKIKIYYDSVAVSNVRLAKITLWNGGNTFLDSQDFLNSIHIKISPSRDAQILEANILKISRENLKHSIAISKDKSIVQLNILDKEVLEANDGFQLQFFYSSKANFAPEWRVDSRIKGKIYGFMNADTERYLSFNLRGFVIIFIIFLATIFNLFSIKNDFLKIFKTASKKDKFQITLIVFIVVLVTIIFPLKGLFVDIFMKPLNETLPEILK